MTQVGLAVRVGNAGAPPSLLAWTEPALAAHNRQLAIFITAVGALIAAAALITARPGHPDRPCRAALVAMTLLLLLWSWLAGTGMFDASLATHIGGPYGLDRLSDRAGAGGGRAAGRRHHSGARYLAAARAKQFRLALYGLCGLGRGWPIWACPAPPCHRHR